MKNGTRIDKINRIQGATETGSARPFTLGDRMYLRFGYPAVRGLHLLATVLVFGVVLFLDYLLVLFTAVNVLPNIAVLVQNGTGVSVDMRLDAVIAGWLIPVLFIVAAVLVGEIFLMRRLWRFAADRLLALAGWLLRLEVEKSPAGKPAPIPAKVKGAASAAKAPALS